MPMCFAITHLIFDRSTELEQMVQALGPLPSLVALLLESVHSSSDRKYRARVHHLRAYLLSCRQNAAYVPLSKAMHITVQQASYSLTVAIVTSGTVPLLWPAISNVYGRRPIFVFVSILGIVAHAASGAAPTWGGILTARAFMGIGTSAGTGIGAAVVADMYFMHERGK